MSESYNNDRPFNQDLTSFQEYAIAGTVVALFGLMYWFFMKDDVDLVKASPSVISASAQTLPNVSDVQPNANVPVISDSDDLQDDIDRLKLSSDSKIKSLQQKVQKTSSLEAENIRLTSLVSSERDKLATLKAQLAESTRLKASESDRLATLSTQNMSQTEKFKQLELKSAQQEKMIASLKQYQINVGKEQQRLKLVAETAERVAQQTELQNKKLEIELEMLRAIPKTGFENELQTALLEGNSGEPIVFDRIYFNSGSATLTAESQDQISKTAAILNSHKDINIRLRGHTDSTGNEQSNLALSLSRSKAMKQRLIEMGVDVSRIATEGLGSSSPLANNASAEGRKQNRRIDLLVIK